MNHEIYQSPFSQRYSSHQMLKIFSPQFKHSTWRRLWVALAEAQKALGLPITETQIKEMTENMDAVDFAAAEKYEKKVHHDVMAHIHAYADQCPAAKPIIHLGATSCYVTDNTDLIQMREGMKLLAAKLQKIISQLADFARKHADLPCLGYTHLQPAQLTTVGKRACLWIQELLLDYNELSRSIKALRFLGAKGATGTQASYLALFEGNHDKVKEMEALIAKKMGFESVFLISGQTYTRKQDTSVLHVLVGLGCSAHKFATDLRLLAHLNEVAEPFKKNQVGSTAMPYKRNPILSERICGLARLLISLGSNAEYTSSLQWLERSLDDSSNRRISIPEAFLTADAILELLLTLTADLTIYPQVIAHHVAQDLPFMATENILMASVKKGGDRQALHEKLRLHSQAAADRVNELGEENDLLARIGADPAFKLSQEDLEKLTNITDFVGRAPQQVLEFLDSEVEQIKPRSSS
jgi:adenylosuccinate lyase